MARSMSDGEVKNHQDKVERLTGRDIEPSSDNAVSDLRIMIHGPDDIIPSLECVLRTVKLCTAEEWLAYV
jgi:hypothetical protein